jgi:hypothetical protein
MVWAVSLTTIDLRTDRLATLLLRPPFLVCLLSMTLTGLSKKQSRTGSAAYNALILKCYRREQAISRIDWPFTSSHKSSEDFATAYGSGFQALRTSHPAHD